MNARQSMIPQNAPVYAVTRQAWRPMRFALAALVASRLVVLSWADAPAVGAPAWPQFRGPNSQGVSETAQPPIAFGPSSNVLWRAEVPAGHSSPVLNARAVYLTSHHQERLWVHALAVDNGRELWRRALPAEAFQPVHETSSVAASTPACDETRVYVYCGDCGVVAYDLDGKEAWRRPLAPPKNLYGCAGSPALVGGLLVVGNFGSDTNSALIALDPKDGTVRWRTTVKCGSMTQSTPVARVVDGRTEVIAFAGGRVAGYEADTGMERWFARGLPTMVVWAPVVDGSRVYVGACGALGNSTPSMPMPTWKELAAQLDRNHDGRVTLDEFPSDFLFVQRPDVPRDDPGYGGPVTDILGKDPKAPEAFFDEKKYTSLIADAEVWSRPNFRCLDARGSGELPDTAVCWSLERGIPEIPSPLLYRGRLYTVQDGGLLRCLDPNTGRELYRERLGALGRYSASPVAGGGKVYLASAAGVITVVKAGDTFERLAQSHLGEPVMATPALVGDRIYVRSGNRLWSFASQP